MTQADTRPRVPIFVSSTFTDMQIYRRKIQDALIQLEQIIRGMEQFGSKPGSPVEECLRIVRSCQLYVGVFGMRYGSVPEGYDKSITHLEYDEAQRVGLSSLIYMLNEDHPIPAKDVETGPGAEKLRGLKELLRKRHVVSVFTTPEDLQARIIYDVPVQLERLGAQIAAEHSEVTILRGSRAARQLELQAALRGLPSEMLETMQLALNGSGTVANWGDPSRKTAEQREATAQAYEGHIPFSAAKYFQDRMREKYEGVLLENLDSDTIYSINSAYSSARQVFDLVGALLPQGATLLAPQLPYLLWRVAADFSKAIPLILDQLKDIEERKRLEPWIQKLNSMLESQGMVVNRL